jgi:hypothetical protein
MVRASLWLLTALTLLTAACGGATPKRDEADSESLILRGFRQVDIEQRRLVNADVVIEHGVVVPHPTLAKQHVVEGHGAFLMPALWDLKSALWGNDSAHNWDLLTQELTYTRCLQVQLYFGIGHVGAFAADPGWADREVKRADALEMPAAESLYPDKTLCRISNFACDEAKTPSAVKALLERRQQRGVPFVDISFVAAPKSVVAGLSPDLLAIALSDAARRKLPSFVLIDDWSSARQAVELGARAIYGFPADPVPDELVQLMRQKDAAFAPALTAFLELDRLLGNRTALEDPLLKATVRPDILRTFSSEKELWSEFRPDLAVARERRKTMLQSVARLSEAGVRILAASDAGWAPGTFQGYSSLALQNLLETAGLDGWTRLAAATTWPAQLLNRHVGFAPGDAADFVALSENPVTRASGLRAITWVMRRGNVVDRARLLPDLTRGNYPQ